MKPQPESTLYAVQGDDGHPRVCVVVGGHDAPSGAIAITDSQAAAISAATREREPKVEPVAGNFVTLDEAERLAAAAAEKAVSAYAIRLSKFTGGGDAL